MTKVDFYCEMCGCGKTSYYKSYDVYVCDDCQTSWYKENIVEFYITKNLSGNYTLVMKEKASADNYYWIAKFVRQRMDFKTWMPLKYAIYENPEPGKLYFANELFEKSNKNQDVFINYEVLEEFENLKEAVKTYRKLLKNE